MAKLKVLIVDGDRLYRRMFEHMGYQAVEHIEDCNLVCFTGGEDVSPNLYGDYQHDKTYNNRVRDHEEKAIYTAARNLSLPMVGICRGAQFLNVMSGGRMYQHVSGHTQSHELVDHFTGEHVYVSSTHHQMMLPGDNGIIIATSIDVDSYREWYDGHIPRHDFSDVGNEVVYYPNSNALCFQPHPEFAMNSQSYQAMYEYFAKYVESLQTGSLVEELSTHQ